jgi:ribokinase
MELFGRNLKTGRHAGVERHAGVPMHVVGSMMIDRVVRVAALARAGETVSAISTATYAGGKGANQAAAAAKCGAHVRMLGRTGADGRFIVDALKNAGVRTRGIATHDDFSGAATVMVAENGENAIIIAPESNTRITALDIERFLATAKQGEIVLFQNECSCLHEGIACAAARALRVWLNAAPADANLGALRFEKLAGLVVNETEAQAMTGERDPARALELLAARMPGGTVIVTLGAQGAIAAVGNARFAHRGFAVDAVDTVGCGDAFVGAFLAAIAEGIDMPAALARANAAGALAAMRVGAIPSLASRAEIDVAAAMPEGARLNARAPVAAIGEKPANCENCNYDLAGRRIGEACPECGRTIAPIRFGGRWIAARVRRRFRNAAWLMAVGAALLALGLGGLAANMRFWPGTLTVIINAFFVSQIVLPIAMFLIAWSCANDRLWKLLAAVACVRMVLHLFTVGVALGFGYLLPTGVVAMAYIAMLACDGVFAVWIERLARGSAVAPQPRARAIALTVVAALALLLWMREDTRFGGLPRIASACWVLLVAWSAVEVVLLARRMRATERAA